MQSRIESACNIFTQPRHFKLRLFIEGNLIGLFTGFLIALFRYLLELSENTLPVLYNWLAANPFFVLPWAGLLLIIGYCLALVVRTEPMTAGSGIPQIKGILLGKMDMNWARVVVLKFIGAV